MSVFKATKKPVTIEAIQWTGDNLKEVISFTGRSEKFHQWFPTWEDYENHVKEEGFTFKVITLEGNMIAHVGDYIIKGVKGEFYPCKKNIFHATYDIHL
jgi:hypothetical protein